MPVQSEPSSEDEDLQIVDELSRRRREEEEAIADEIDRETETEHEVPEVGRTGEPVEGQEGILSDVVERMDEPRELLATSELEGGERDPKLERLASLLRRFKEREIQPCSCFHNAEVSGSVRKPGSARKKNRKSRVIRPLGEMAFHMQREHGASK
jgi:hypothetical protein